MPVPLEDILHVYERALRAEGHAKGQGVREFFIVSEINTLVRELHGPHKYAQIKDPTHPRMSLPTGDVINICRLLLIQRMAKGN